MTKSRARKFADIMGGTFVGLIEDGQIDVVDVDGLSAIQTKVNGIEANATADQTAAEIKTAYESNADTNEFSDAEQTKLAAIEASATADQTAAEIKTAYESNSDTNEFSDAEQTKLAGIEASADVTDTANVVAALTAGSNITIASDGTIAGAAQYTHPTHPGDDFSVDTGTLTGATVVSDIDINLTTDGLGHVTDANGSVATRTLTLANLGYTGATNANYITNNNQLTNGAGYTTNVGDITNVSAGTNLTGGGSSGSVTVNLAATPNVTSLNVGGSEVVSSSRGLKNIASVDATTAASITAAGVGGGGTVDLTADGSISSGDVVGVSGNGTVATSDPLFGPVSAFTSSQRQYVSAYWDQSASKVVVASANSSRNTIVVRVGTIASSGALTWGTEATYTGYTSLDNICVAMHNNVALVSFTASNWGRYRMMRSFGVSGTTVNSSSGNQYLDSNQYSDYGNKNVQTLMADPNNSGKFVSAHQGESSAYPRAAIIAATGTSASSTTYRISTDNTSCTKAQIAYNPTSGKFMGLWTGGGNTVTAASLTVSGSALSIGTVIKSDLSQSSDQTSMGFSSGTGNFLYFTRDGGKLYGWSVFTNASGNATGFGDANLIATGSGSDWYSRYTYNSNGVTTVGAWQMGDGNNSKLYLIADTAGGNLSVDGDSIDISSTASSSGSYGGPWGMQDKGTFVSFDGQTSPYNASEINTASTYFTAIGISEGNYTNGQTATITIPGGVTNTVSGLASGAYYQPSLSTGGGLDGGGTFAQALNTNQLLIK